MNKAVRTSLSLVLLAGGALAGCYGYASYPPIDSAHPVINNPNAPPTDELMMLATKWVADRYPPPHAGPVVAGEALFAINLPEGVRRDVYERVSERTGGRAAPLTAENAKTLPVYHISRVWVRMRDAKVDVMRPRLDVPPRPDGQPVYECITLLCEGGLQPWRVARFQTWQPGIIDTPSLYYCPEDYGNTAIPPPRKTVPEASPGVDKSGAPIPKPESDAPKAGQEAGAGEG